MLTEDSIFYHSTTDVLDRDELSIMIDRNAPNWIGVDERGRNIIERFDGSRTFGNIVREYGRDFGFEPSRAWQDVATVVSDGLRQKYLRSDVNGREVYSGRAAHLENEPLRELWLHTNNSCNLACTHCLVSSGPDGHRGLPPEKLIAIIHEARRLGTKRFYFTGGEPFVRRDIFSLIDAVLEDEEAELAILTNGMLLREHTLEELKARDLDRLRLQISLDGSTAKYNDPIRGAGTFEKILAGIRDAISAGIHVTMTTVVTEENADDIPNATRLVAELGGTSHHLLWMHKRGRAESGEEDRTPSVEKLIEVVDKARIAGRECGVIIDNYEALKARIKAQPETKNDLAGAAVNTICVYPDGKVYPSAATADIEELCLGSVERDSLEQVWRNSEVSRRFRAASVQNKEKCRDCRHKFLCGGGDIEHSYFYGGSLEAHDPYCELHKAMFDDALVDLTESRRALGRRAKSGFKAPYVFTGMGDGAIHCAHDEDHNGDLPGVKTIHSECVLSFDLDAPRKLVRNFYGDAADTPQEDLCCPVRPNPEDLTHIPSEVVERFYGCGSPVQDADIRPGETTLDLGSGAGIDVFISAKKSGPTGKSIGVDMTDRMLKVAFEQKPIVAGNLGYDNIEFRKGFLEEIPAEDKSVDLVTSNCVINLSPDKQQVLSEIWRILDDHGRLVISDIVSEVEVPPHQRRDPRLWGECISGALTEEEFIAYLERTGFYGVQVMKKTFWKEVEGYRFYSVTVRGYKFEKTDGCVFRGQKAIYQGPFKGISDEEGHWFPRQVPVEVCTDTAAKLSRAPYEGMFVITDPDGAVTEFACCDPVETAATSCC